MLRAVVDARELDIEVLRTKARFKEQDTTRSHASRRRSGERTWSSKTSKCYRIELYFPKHKIAVECDENGHSKEGTLTD